MPLEEHDHGNAATPTITAELAAKVDEPHDPPTSRRPEHLQLGFLSDASDTSPVSTISLPTFRRRAFRLLRILRKWEKRVDVIVRRDGKDISECFPVVIMFDPQCHVDIASTHLLRDTFGFTLDYSNRRAIGKTILGSDVNSVGEVDLRWWGGARKRFRPRFEESRVFVVESDEFELIIGRETMDRVLVNRSNSIIAAFMSIPPSHDARTVAADQQDANMRRSEHKAEKQRRKEQKTKAPKPQQSQSQSQSQS